jgi:hypothetical protein
MNVIKAAERSFELATSKREEVLNPLTAISVSESTTLPHMKNMIEQMKTGNFSSGKLNRWLGWIQGSIVSMINPVVTLEDMKQINKECDEDVPLPLVDLATIYDNYRFFYKLDNLSPKDQLSLAMSKSANSAHIAFLGFFIDQWEKSEKFYSFKPE